MEATAKVWLKYDNRWIAPGERFDVADEDAAGIAQYATLTAPAEEVPAASEKPAETKTRTSRKKK